MRRKFSGMTMIVSAPKTLPILVQKSPLRKGSARKTKRIREKETAKSAAATAAWLKSSKVKVFRTFSLKETAAPPRRRMKNPNSWKNPRNSFRKMTLKTRVNTGINPPGEVVPREGSYSLGALKEDQKA